VGNPKQVTNIKSRPIPKKKERERFWKVPCINSFYAILVLKNSKHIIM
jgi:hypothetical protein